MGETNNKATDMNEQEELRQKLLWNVKREVKQMMEEAVMKKCIHEENCSITTLCASVEACLLHGLKRRAVGLFKTTTTTALLQKIAKTCSDAAEVVKIIEDDNRLNEEPNSLVSLSRKISSMAHHQPASVEESRRRTTRSAVYTRYLWIRTALIHRSLHKIVEYIVNDSSKYYEPYALVCHSVQGPILASLLVGPCALEFTRVKTSDHIWTDPHADELVQRHRMHSNNRAAAQSTAMMMSMNSSLKYRPTLQINLKRHASSSGEEAQKHSQLISINPARDYVESLHQNAKSQLIYGKNNVFVQPNPGCDPIPGYLSLHHYHHGLTLKWTPNQLMNGYNANTKTVKHDSPDTNESEVTNLTDSPKRHSVYWDYAISINLSSIVYLHCHQHVDGDRIVFVGRDGVQYPPFHIKDKGGHLLAFLTCLETGLAPYGQLDPPLEYKKGEGKVLPTLHRKTERPRHAISLSASDDDSSGPSNTENSNTDPSAPTGDYVFRILFFSDYQTMNSPANSRWQWASGTMDSPSLSSQLSTSPPAQTTDTNALPLPASPTDATFATSAVYVSPMIGLHKSISVRSSMASLCDTMRRQILSRAFYGWLGYCRHLKTVRTHLTSLVNPVVKLENSEQQSQPNISLTFDAWAELFLNRQQENLPIDKKEIYRRIYSGGCEHSIRKQVWPFLFSHYSFDSNIDERNDIDRTTIERYNTLSNEWHNAEQVVIQIDLQHSNRRKNTLTKLFNASFETVNPNSTESTLTSIKNVLASIPEKISMAGFHVLERKDSNASNDVFYEDCPVHKIAIPIVEESIPDADLSPEQRSSSTSSSNPSVLIARTHTESVIDRSSPYNIIETSTEMDDNEEMDDTDDVQRKEKENTLSPSSSLTSGTDVYMDAVDIINEDANDQKSDGSLTPICYGSFSKEIIDTFAVNLHRIDKDVARCDRTYAYFTNVQNLKKLRNIMCTYVWDNLSTGYIQGMCDLVAPLLVIFDEEVMAYSCFCALMKRLLPNFPHGAGMDEHFGHMRSLLQILDFELYEHIHRTGDFTHFYFCYRWFLLDFKREFVYEDIFFVWETIAAARRTVSKRFVLFIALSMLKIYREIILDNRMDFTDIIRFFNEMAERHDANEILRIARELVLELQKLIDNK